MIPRKGIPIQVKVPEEIKEVFLLSPDLEVRSDLKYELIKKVEGNFVRAVIPNLEIYFLMVVELFSNPWVPALQRTIY